MVRKPADADGIHQMPPPAARRSVSGSSASSHGGTIEEASGLADSDGDDP
jgi:hypothetical protein